MIAWGMWVRASPLTTASPFLPSVPHLAPGWSILEMVSPYGQHPAVLAGCLLWLFQGEAFPCHWLLVVMEGQEVRK